MPPMFALVHPDDIENLRDTMKESAMRLCLAS